MNVVLNRQSHRSKQILITAPDQPGDLGKRRASIWSFRLPGDLTRYTTMNRHKSEAAARREIKGQWGNVKIRELHRVN